MKKNKTRKIYKKTKKNSRGGAVAPPLPHKIIGSSEEDNPATTQEGEREEANSFADATISDWESIEQYIKDNENSIAFDEEFFKITKRIDDGRRGIATRVNLISGDKIGRLMNLAEIIDPIITAIHVKHDAENKMRGGKIRRKRTRSRKSK
jgi:hypothetical protein